MKITEFIKELESVLEEHGDLEVQTSFYDGRREARKPQVAYALVLQGREYKPRFWDTCVSENRKGGKVCRI